MRSIFLSLIAFISLIPVAVFAQNGGNNNLVNLPIGETGDFNDYINAVYLMFISIAALIAVVKIIIAGVKYMFSDIVTQKSDAKRDIQGALLGLLVVLAAVVVLSIINPDLTKFDPEISRIPERKAPVQDNSINQQKTQTIEDFIRQNPGEKVATQSCTYFDSNKPFGIAGSVLAPVDGLLNAATCKVWCDGLSGEVVEKECVYVEDFDQKDLVESIIKDSGYCDTAGCETLDCSFFRTEGSCKTWCDNRGGVNIETSYLFTTQQCLVAKIPLEQTTVINCESDGSTTDCRAARSLCELSGGTSIGQKNDSNTLEISCTPPPAVETFPCIDMGRSQFDCTAAEAKCTGNRVATRSGSDIICE